MTNENQISGTDRMRAAADLFHLTCYDVFAASGDDLQRPVTVEEFTTIAAALSGFVNRQVEAFAIIDDAADRLIKLTDRLGLNDDD